jgi:hypothetical protein
MLGRAQLDPFVGGWHVRLSIAGATRGNWRIHHQHARKGGTGEQSPRAQDSQRPFGARADLLAVDNLIHLCRLPGVLPAPRTCKETIATLPTGGQPDAPAQSALSSWPRQPGRVGPAMVVGFAPAVGSKQAPLGAGRPHVRAAMKMVGGSGRRIPQFGGDLRTVIAVAGLAMAV